MFSELKDRLLRCIAFSLRRPVQIKLISFYLIKLQIKSIALLTMVENWFKVIVKVELFFLWRWISAWALAKLALRLTNSSADFARTGKWALNLHHENIILFSSLKSFDLFHGYEHFYIDFTWWCSHAASTSSSPWIWAAQQAINTDTAKTIFIILLH